MCRRCREGLSRFEQPQGDGTVAVSYVHVRSSDHDPEPIDNDGSLSQVSRCDFCSGPGPRWVYPCGDFVITVPNDDDRGYTGGWAACSECHDDIEAGRWGNVTTRWLNGRPEVGSRAEPHLRAQMAVLHTAFTSHRQGPATPYS